MRRKILSIVIGLAVLILVALALQPEVVKVEVAAVARGPLAVTVDGNGKTRVRERFVVAAPAAGHLERLTLTAGDVVQQGDVVARVGAGAPMPLDTRTQAELRARLAAAESAAEEARAARERAAVLREQAEGEMARLRHIEASGGLSARELEQARFAARVRTDELRMAEFALQRAGREVAAARATFRGATPQGAAPGDILPIRAPVAGVVLRVHQKSEGPIAAGTPILEIGDPRRLEVAADLLTLDAVRIQPGAAATVTAWGGDVPLAGVVRRVEPAAFTKVSALGVEEQRVTVLIDPEGPAEEWRRLGDGYAVDVRITVRERSGALKVPASALVRADSGWAVFAVDEGVARLRPVSLGAQATREVEIATGLNDGTSVVLYPSDAVREGTRVEID